MEKKIDLEDYSIEEIEKLCGLNDENLVLIEHYFHISMTHRGSQILLIDDIDEMTYQHISELIKQLLGLVKKGVRIGERDILYALRLLEKGRLNILSDLYEIRIAKTLSGKLIYPKTLGQRAYYFALKKNDVVFGIGPAGTGKTYLAVVFAINALKNNEVKKIVLTRPAVEAGENLGFLPGDLKEKVDPYLRPLYDALYDMLGQEQTERLIEKGTIEIAPLAYMRGRTLEDAYVILDEAQNTTDAQMKMFLTRLGFHSKMIITGDVTQIDLPHGVYSGLKRAYQLLHGVDGIAFIELSALDVVRHPVVQRIIQRYEDFESQEG